MTKDQIDNFASKIAASIYNGTSVFTTDKWIVEFETISNYKIQRSVIDGVVLVSLYFGIYFIQRKAQTFFDDQKLKVFNEELKRVIIFYLSTVYFESVDKEQNPEKHLKRVKDTFEALFSQSMDAYSSYTGGNITILFKAFVQNEFNSSIVSPKIKFTKNSFKNRFLINLAMVMGGPNASFANDTVLDEKILDNYVQNIVSTLTEIDFHPEL
ncbi:MAG: hypothetical protein WC843_03085 [Candidatus Gracilibacteria bacterium]|jgi:hypothetical protein